MKSEQPSLPALVSQSKRAGTLAVRSFTNGSRGYNCYSENINTNFSLSNREHCLVNQSPVLQCCKKHYSLIPTARFRTPKHRKHNHRSRQAAHAIEFSQFENLKRVFTPILLLPNCTDEASQLLPLFPHEGMGPLAAAARMKSNGHVFML